MTKVEVLDKEFTNFHLPVRQDWDIAGGGYWGGRWQTGNLTLEVLNPDDDSTLGYVTDASEADVSDAISGVKGSLSKPWPLWQRRESLERAHQLVLDESRRLTDIVSAESSKTVAEARREVGRCAETLRLSAAASSVLDGQTLPLEDSPRGAGRVGWSRREPIGVVAAITPFNDPLNLVAHKVGPALIAGNGVVLKPAHLTPFSALALTEILLRAGVPATRIATLVGSGSIGAALVADPRIDLISFTGGPLTADRIAKSAGARKLLMELGGNNATIVCSDADIPKAAEAVVAGSFGVAGQNCLSVQRVYAHRSVFDALLKIVVEKTSSLRAGIKTNSENDLGPLITRAEAERVDQWVTEAKVGGATVHTGGVRNGNFYAPTVVTGAKRTDRIVAEEVFGPIVTLIPFDTIAEAVAQADSTEYGLQAGIFTSSIDTGLQIASQLRVGTALINDTSDFRIDSMPFGGFKKSGIGREGVVDAVTAMSEPKNLIINAHLS